MYPDGSVEIRLELCWKLLLPLCCSRCCFYYAGLLVRLSLQKKITKKEKDKKKGKGEKNERERERGGGTEGRKRREGEGEKAPARC